MLGDAKRGDIDSTAAAYAQGDVRGVRLRRLHHQRLPGARRGAPSCAYRERGVFVLCRTSNRIGRRRAGRQVDGRKVYEHVARRRVEWNGHGNCGLVVGATYPAELARVRALAPGLPILIPASARRAATRRRAARDAPAARS